MKSFILILFFLLCVGQRAQAKALPTIKTVVEIQDEVDHEYKSKQYDSYEYTALKAMTDEQEVKMDECRFDRQEDSASRVTFQDATSGCINEVLGDIYN